MKTISRYIMTLALLLTAAGGAWADEVKVTIDASDYDAISTYTSFSKEKDGITIAFSSSGKNSSAFDLQNGSTVTITSTVGKIKSAVFYCMAAGTAKYGPGCLGSPTAGQYGYNDFIGIWTGEAETFTLTSTNKVRIEKIDVTVGEADDPNAIKVTTNAASKQDLFTEAWFNMPTFDATAEYELVRDMSVQMTAQVGDDPEAQPRYRVKKDGNKFIPAEMEMAAVPALFTVNDAIEQKALTQTQDYIVQIYAIDAEGQPTGDPMTFATFTFEPGIYAVKAVAAQGSDYDGETDLSNKFVLFEGYDLTVKPANDFSKGKIESVTVGSGSVTIDANTGEATKTDIAPETEVKIKAKRGYVIDKVEVKKAGPALKTITVNGMQLNYVEGDTWQQAIERPENAGSGWRVQNNYIFNGGYTLFTKGGGGATYVYVKPGDTIDATKNYSLEAD